MNSSESQAQFTVLAERIWDADLLDQGFTPEQIQQMKQLAEVERRLLSSGVSLEAIKADWAAQTPEQILAQPLPEERVPQTTNNRIETDWLCVTIKQLVSEPKRSLIFQAAITLKTGEIQRYEESALVANAKQWDLLRKLFYQKRLIEIRLEMSLDDDTPNVLRSVQEAKIERKSSLSPR